MTRIDEQLELRITEHLDGRLDADAEAELYRELLRNPQARDLMDRYAANDRDASLALRAVVMAPSRSIDVDQWTRRRWRIPWAQVMATAALMLMVVGVWMAIEYLPDTLGIETGGPTVARETTSTPTPAQPRGDVIVEHEPAGRGPDASELTFAAIPEPAGEPWWRRAARHVATDQPVEARTSQPLVAGPQHIQRVKDRSLLGVFDDESKTVYWMQVDREKTRIHAVGGEL